MGTGKHSYNSAAPAALVQPPPDARRRRSARRKVLLTLAALLAAGSIAGLVTFATFTSTTTVSSSAAAGTVVIALGGSGLINRLTVNASGLVPTDTIQRGVDLTNTGSQNLASLTLGVSATASSLLDTDTTNGLQMVIDRCFNTAWTESGNGTTTPYTYVCGATTQTVVASTPVVNSSISLAGLVTPTALTAGGTDHLRVTLTLPTNAPNTMQGVTSTFLYTFTGTQRAGASH